MKFASISRSLAACALVLSLSACDTYAVAGQTNAQAAGEGSLYEQLLLQDSWSISQLGGKRNVANGAATLSFGREGRLSAYAGCNRMAASYVYHAGALEIGPLISTKMACMPETKMRDEQALGAALNQQRLTLVATQNGLALMRGNAKVMELVPLVP